MLELLNFLLVIFNVFYVPEFQFNLMSVSKLCNALNCTVNFNGSKCFIQEKSTLRMIGSGERRKELYYLVWPDKVACSTSKLPSHFPLPDTNPTPSHCPLPDSTLAL